MFEKIKNLPKPKKIILLASISLLAILVVGSLTIVILSSNNIFKQKPVVTFESANEVKENAVEAIKNDDKEMAKELLQEAKEQYEELGDTNNKIDSEALLFLMEHAQ